ncbi:Dipeptide transport system permease protein DppC [Pseudomonas chlororaphis subsp. aurantiaca]|uniref:ABC transporter permease n=1 Tax=Pseudomonas chlororaphis TaxID=587753 RepID=UPI00087A0978|nr:ABC transporter permease [Pseudomonas chlororaphis]AZD36405.1 Dipeptide transport system permease protein DppC [Pseudomonas chlororaphis subsp. aurantiaca]AZD42744.1 Dipeptide transport system permease protein DppC [Pseudomonas chlororaphis subsp. aurantiaca]AZD67679.1 Dipeptide transport system permease protein DppC [Pseudomonas chlororaphis subsp. aurantiaca]QIT23643.1 ABC transporter permease [Pseudomonas chlororaphis subsp. aurantiaca]WDH01739.1 ABC transporter permease [Pseudomonas chl
MSQSTVWRRFIGQPSALLGALFLLLSSLLAVAAPWLAQAAPWEMSARPMLAPFQDPAHWLGSDLLGRDLASGLLYGARVSLAVGALASLATLVVGSLVGAVAGYVGGWLDGVLMRIAEFFQIIPQLVLAVILVAILEPSLGSIVLAIALVAWPAVARLVRSEFLSLRQREFVQAARVLGQSPWAIASRQILPNALAPLLVTMTFVMATAILTEAALAFLGLSDPEAMSWGYMINASRGLLRDAWWMSLLPGGAILLCVLAVNRVGEGLRVAFEPARRNGESP